MKKTALILSILLAGFVLAQDDGLNPVQIDDRICFTLDEGNQLFSVWNDYPILVEALAQAQTIIEEKNAQIKEQKKKTIRAYFIALCIGAASFAVASLAN